GLKVLRTKTPARRPMSNNMISMSHDGKPCVSEAYSVLFLYNFIHLILVRVVRKSLIRKTLILIRVPFLSAMYLRSGDSMVSIGSFTSTRASLLHFNLVAAIRALMGAVQLTLELGTAVAAWGLSQSLRSDP